MNKIEQVTATLGEIATTADRFYKAGYADGYVSAWTEIKEIQAQDEVKKAEAKTTTPGETATITKEAQKPKEKRKYTKRNVDMERKPTSGEIAKILNLYDAKMSTTEIAEIVKLTPAKVLGIIRNQRG